MQTTAPCLNRCARRAATKQYSAQAHGQLWPRSAHRRSPPNLKPAALVAPMTAAAAAAAAAATAATLMQPKPQRDSLPQACALLTLTCYYVWSGWRGQQSSVAALRLLSHLQVLKHHTVQRWPHPTLTRHTARLWRLHHRRRQQAQRQLPTAAVLPPLHPLLFLHTHTHALMTRPHPQLHPPPSQRHLCPPSARACPHTTATHTRVMPQASLRTAAAPFQPRACTRTSAAVVVLAATRAVATVRPPLATQLQQAQTSARACLC